MKYLVAILWLVFFACTLTAQSVTLPVEKRIRAGAWSIIAPSAVDPADGALEWEIDPGLEEQNLSDLLGPELAGKLRGKVISGNKVGRYAVRCWTAKVVAGKAIPSKISTCWVVIGDGPGPPDPITPISIAKHLSFIGVNTSTAAIAADTGLRDYLKSVGVAVHVVAASDAEKYKLHNAVTKAGGVPCFVLQDADGKVIDQAKLTSVSEVKALAGKYVK